jgi:hypothetical protein
MGVEFLASCMASERVEFITAVLLPLVYVESHPFMNVYCVGRR